MTDLGATTATARPGRDDNPQDAGSRRSGETAGSRRTETAGSRRTETAVSLGDTIGGRYVVEEVLGSGGMGVVVAARHATLGHRVAMKFVSASAHADADALARFSREARIIASLESEHVVRVTDFGVHAGSPYMVMDLLAGRDLSRELQERGPLPLAEAVDYLIQACDGLWSTHAKGIVHRDVKLANLFLATRADGERVIKVLDFGVSKSQPDAQDDASLTRTATMIGSPLYMAPEQIRDPRRVDERADVWSLGIVLYKLLTDQAPFSGQSTNAVCAAIAADPPAPLQSHAADLPRELEAVVFRCLEKRPEHRYPSVAALARDLAPFASEAGATLVRQLVSRAIQNDPRGGPALDGPWPDSGASLGFVSAAPSGNGPRDAGEPQARASRAWRPAVWATLGVVAIAGSLGVWLERPGPSTAESSAAATSAGIQAVLTAAPSPASLTWAAPAASSPAAPSASDTSAAASTPLASSPSPNTPIRTDAPWVPGSSREPRHPQHKRAIPAPPPRAAPAATTRFGGSALDDHQ